MSGRRGQVRWARTGHARKLCESPLSGVRPPEIIKVTPT